MKNRGSRVFTVKQQLKNIFYGAKGFVLLKKMKKTGLMNKQFKERIMLSITEVNGCEMCSYVHTKVALSSGMSSEEIKQLLNGDITNIPTNEAVAILFAQHFASTKEQPETEPIERLIDEYGYQKAELIVAASNMITMTNGMGTSLDYLWNRIKFNKHKNSTILIEVFNPLFTMLLFPIFVLFFYTTSIFGYRPKPLKPLYNN
jgi:AhpD family alkylhydroperoxidase